MLQSPAKGDRTCISTYVDKTSLVLSDASLARDDTKCISTCVDQFHKSHQRENNMLLNMCLPNSSHASSDTKCKHASKDIKFISTWVDHASEDTKCISAWVDQSPLMPARTENACWCVKKPFPFQRGHKTYHILNWPNQSHASVQQICISNWVHQTPHKPARNKMNLILCWPYSSHAKEIRSCNSTCVDKIPPKPAMHQICW